MKYRQIVPFVIFNFSLDHRCFFVGGIIAQTEIISLSIEEYGENGGGSIFGWDCLENGHVSLDVFGDLELTFESCSVVDGKVHIVSERDHSAGILAFGDQPTFVRFKALHKVYITWIELVAEFDIFIRRAHHFTD